MDLFTRKCGHNKILRRFEHCERCLDAARLRARAGAGLQDGRMWLRDNAAQSGPGALALGDSSVTTLECPPPPESARYRGSPHQRVPRLLVSDDEKRIAIVLAAKVGSEVCAHDGSANSALFAPLQEYYGFDDWSVRRSARCRLVFQAGGWTRAPSGPGRKMRFVEHEITLAISDLTAKHVADAWHALHQLACATQFVVSAAFKGESV